MGQVGGGKALRIGGCLWPSGLDGVKEGLVEARGLVGLLGLRRAELLRPPKPAGGSHEEVFVQAPSHPQRAVLGALLSVWDTVAVLAAT